MDNRVDEDDDCSRTRVSTRPRRGCSNARQGAALKKQARQLEQAVRVLGKHAQYNWEAGKARPRDSYLATIAALKTLGRRAAATHLAAMDAAR